MTRVLINFCSIEELMSLPGLGAKGADKILEMREATRFAHWQDLPGGRPIQYLITTVHC